VNFEETEMQKIILKAVVRFLLIAMLCAGVGSYGYGQSAVDGGWQVAHPAAGAQHMAANAGYVLHAVSA